MCRTGLEHIELLMSKEVPGQNRGFGFLEFYNHTCANAAKGILSAPTYKCASFAMPPVHRARPNLALASFQPRALCFYRTCLRMPWLSLLHACGCKHADANRGALGIL